MLRIGILTALLTLAAMPGHAQDWQCADLDKLPQQGLNFCAHEDWAAADKILNATYTKAVKAMRQLDADQPKEQQGAVDALRDAQRAWIKFRDLACESEGYISRGGTMEPLLVFTCMTDLTEHRTKALEFLSEAY